ncbi:MAG: YfhO family protein [Verrucomicrobia bacterium]|nr:YfhO family protein [Verrucomicrobiota bacterium]
MTSEETSAPETPTADAWFTPARFAVLLAVLMVIPFYEVLLGFKTFYFRDFGYFSYPAAQFQRECFWRGEVPLWNPWSCNGLPFLAQWNTVALYPGTLIYLLLPMPWSLNVYVLAHLFFGGMGMYFLATRWSGNRFAAAAAGVLYAFNGVALNCLMWFSHEAALGWMPWVVLATQRAWREGGRAIVIAALAGGMQMLTGSPEVILLTWGIAAALMLGDLLQRNEQRKWQIKPKPLLRFLAIVLLVTGLAAAQLLPFLDFLPHTDRDKDTVAALNWAMPVWGWANFLVPLFRCFVTGAGVCFQYGQDWTTSYYFGAGAFVLALLALWRVREPMAWFLGGLFGLSLVLALGDDGFIFAWLRQLIPQLGLNRFTVKFVLITTFCLPLLAALAIAQLRASDEPASVRRWRNSVFAFGGIALAAMVFIVWWSYSHPVLGELFTASWQHGLMRALYLVLILGGLCFLPRWRRDQFEWLPRVALLVLLWLDVWTHAPTQNPAIPPESLASGVVREHWRQAGITPFPALGGARVFTPKGAYDQLDKKVMGSPAQDYLAHRIGLFVDCNLLENLPSMDGFFSLYVREQRGLWSIIFFAPTNHSSAPLLDFMGVGLTNCATNALVWNSRPSFMPLATGGQVPLFTDLGTTLRALNSTSFDPRRVVHLPPEAAGKITATNAATVRVLNQQLSPHRLTFEVEADRPALFVLSQTHYHSWRAYRDGEAVPIWRANHAFQAVELKAGRQTVRFAYEDKAFRLGAAISLLTLAGCVGFLLLRRKSSVP